MAEVPSREARVRRYSYAAPEQLGTDFDDRVFALHLDIQVAIDQALRLWLKATASKRGGVHHAVINQDEQALVDALLVLIRKKGQLDEKEKKIVAALRSLLED